MSTRAIARRYAQALFELASEQRHIDAYRQGLHALAQVVANSEVERLLSDPKVDDTAKARVLTTAAKPLSKELQRLVALLCQRGKAVLLPEIYEVFAELEREAAAEAEVEVVTAIPIEDALQKKLQQAIAREVGRKVQLKTRVDADLIGGMVIRIGDRRIDRSVRGRLEGLRRALAA